MDTPDTEPRQISRTVEIPVFRNHYGTLFNDKTRGPSGAAGHYLRWQWSQAGVVAIPLKDGRYGVWRMYRYPIGESSWEFPRGGVDPGESVEAAALRELAEETGCSGATTLERGRLFAESGLVGSPVSVVEVGVSRVGHSENEPMESVLPSSLWLSSREFANAVAAGQITCGITIAAWAMREAVIHV